MNHPTRPAADRLRRSAAAVLAAILLSGLAACAPTADPAAFCARLLRRTVEQPTTRLVLVADESRSRAGLDDGAMLEDVVRTASQHGATLSVLAADGAGTPPRWLLKDAALNVPGEPSDTRRFAVAVERSPGCVAGLLRSVRPSRPGTDLGAALRAAAESVRPGARTTVVVLSDGLSTTGDLDLTGRVARRDPAALVREAVEEGAVPSMAGVAVRLVGIAKLRDRVVPAASAAWLRSFWSSWCRAADAASCRVAVVDQGADPSAAVPAARPADGDVALPADIRWRGRGGTVFDASAALAFDGDSAIVHATRDSGMQRVLRCLRLTTGRVVVDGYVNPGTDEAFDDRLAARRAEHAAAWLAAASAQPAARFHSAGHGGDDPVGDPSTAEGAAANRRVTVMVEGRCG